MANHVAAGNGIVEGTMCVVTAAIARARKALQPRAAVSEMAPAATDNLQRVHVKPLGKNPRIAIVAQAFGYNSGKSKRSPV